MPWVINGSGWSIGPAQGTKKLYVRFEAAEEIIEISGTKQLKKKIVPVDGTVTTINGKTLMSRVHPTVSREKLETSFCLYQIFGRR